VTAAAARSAGEIQRWICSRIAERIGIESDEVDPDQPFVTFGIGSRDSITLVGELEDWLGRQLKATMMYDFPTVRSLAAALETA
jgi:acyl carrier protein